MSIPSLLPEIGESVPKDVESWGEQELRSFYLLQFIRVCAEQLVGKVSSAVSKTCYGCIHNRCSQRDHDLCLVYSKWEQIVACTGELLDSIDEEAAKGELFDFLSFVDNEKNIAKHRFRFTVEEIRSDRERIRLLQREIMIAYELLAYMREEELALPEQQIPPQSQEMDLDSDW